MIEELPSPAERTSQMERFRARLKLIESRVQQQSQEEKLNQVRALLREEATQILLPALQDAMAQMTLQVLPDPRLGESIERTNQEVAALAASMGHLGEAQRKAEKSAREATERLASTMEAMFAATTEEVTGGQQKAAEDLMRAHRRESQRQRFWTLASIGMSAVVMLAIAFGLLTWWRLDQKSRLGAELESLNQERGQLATTLASLKEEVRLMAEAKTELESRIDLLQREETGVRVKIRESAETVSAVDQARAKVQEDIRRLQEIQEKNRFKLLPGAEGAVFVEVGTGAKPFVYQGKTYIRLEE